MRRYILLLLLALPAQAETLVEVHTASQKAIAVIVQTPPLEELDTAPLALDPNDWLVDGSQPAALYRYSIPYDQDNLLKVSVRHRVYLELADPLVQDHVYALVTPFGSPSFAFDEDLVFCEAIKVNQVGYHAGSTSRFANYGVFLGNGGTQLLASAPAYTVVREDGLVVASGTGVHIDDTVPADPNTITSGEHVYRLSLNSVPEGGPYHVVVQGCGRSRSFGVGSHYVRQAAEVYTRGLYHQRCGIALEPRYTRHSRGICHTTVYDTRAAGVGGKITTIPEGTPSFSIAGSYHDAGDFDRRPYHPVVPILMMGYYEAWPEHFVDGQYNIPESWNGIPDFLDEALWGVRLWDELQVTDDPNDPDYGAVRDGTETHSHPGYGGDTAANNQPPDWNYGTWAVSVPTTATAAGLLAQASRLIAPYDAARSTELLAKARLAWDWLEVNTDVAATNAKLMYAALQLYLATGETEFHDIFKTTANNLVVLNNGAFPENYLPGNASSSCYTPHFSSYLLTAQPTDAALVANLKATIASRADDGGYMGPNSHPESTAYPAGVTKFMGLGAGTAQGRYADVQAFAHLFTTDPVKRQTYFNEVAQYSDFSLGLNPIGISFVTGLGTDQLQSPLQLDSYVTKYGLGDGITSEHFGAPKGNVPGILVYGMHSGRSGLSYQRAVSDKLFPIWEDLPQLRRWADGWSLINGNEFTIMETQVWNIVMFGFLNDVPVAPLRGGSLGGGIH